MLLTFPYRGICPIHKCDSNMAPPVSVKCSPVEISDKMVLKIKKTYLYVYTLLLKSKTLLFVFFSDTWYWQFSKPTEEINHATKSLPGGPVQKIVSSFIQDTISPQDGSLEFHMYYSFTYLNRVWVYTVISHTVLTLGKCVLMRKCPKQQPHCVCSVCVL